MEEIWKYIPGFPGYQASSYGNIRSVDRDIEHANGIKTVRRGRILSPRPDSNGYMKIGLGRGGKKITQLMHRLVLLTFVGPQPSGCNAAHNDGCRPNNRLDNLRWATHRENCQDKMRHGTLRRGELHPRARLSVEAAREIRNLYGELTGREIAKRLGFGVSTVYRVINGQTWT